ncbi:MAG: hypothetical protein RL571_2522 [Pseudomonadota bacterium]|jgi:hypothetical protein
MPQTYCLLGFNKDSYSGNHPAKSAHHYEGIKKGLIVILEKLPCESRGQLITQNPSRGRFNRA